MKKECLYCHSQNLEEAYIGEMHRYQTDYGPFDLYNCGQCEALLTYPLPSEQTLIDFYSRSESGMPQVLRQARSLYPQKSIYQNYYDIISSRSKILKIKESFSWCDVGAGEGEFVQIVKESHSKSDGSCMDFHERPKRLERVDVNWTQQDLNSSDFSHNQRQYDIVFSMAVFEHLRDPENFLHNIEKLIATEGEGFLIFPRYDSFFAKVLKRKWPYYIPGEHLSMPTAKSLDVLLPKYFKDYNYQSIPMKYSLKYILSYLKLSWMAKILPFDIELPLYAGTFLVHLKK